MRLTDITYSELKWILIKKKVQYFRYKILGNKKKRNQRIKFECYTSKWNLSFYLFRTKFLKFQYYRVYDFEKHYKVYPDSAISLYNGTIFKIRSALILKF